MSPSVFIDKQKQSSELINLPNIFQAAVMATTGCFVLCHDEAAGWLIYQ